MNLTSGKFTAPKAGTYFFSFKGKSYFPISSSRLDVDVRIYLNGNPIGSDFSDEISTVVQFDSLFVQSTLNLQAGDQIWLQIFGMSTGTNLFDNLNCYTHFVGWLLEERIAQSLNFK